MAVAEIIETKLRHALAVDSIEVIDESHKHAGHAGAREGGESHFLVRLVSKDFTGKNRVAMQRMVYGALKEEMAEQIHALSLDLRCPE